MQRDNLWLQNKLSSIHQTYFTDKSWKNPVVIRFGKKARCQLGSIRMRKRFLQNPTSWITINSIFRDEQVPEFIIDATIAHELTHYFQGFSSSLPKQQEYPHLGGVVTKELKSRGLEKILKLQKKWLKEQWPAIVKSYFPHRIHRRTHRRLRLIFG